MWRPGKTTYISSYSVHTIRKNILLEGALMKPFNKRNKRLYISTIIGAIFVSAAGTLLHFVYGWTGNHFIVGLFAPVNESTWEHMKLLYFPMLLYCAAEYFFLAGHYQRLIRADLAGILAGTWLIPVAFYTYTGILGFHTLTLDILTFLFSVLTAFYVRYHSLLLPGHIEHTLFDKIFKTKPGTKCRGLSGPAFFYFICVLITGVCFLIFTYYPPAAGLFVPPA